MKVNYKQARKFLEGIGRKDKVAIYTHVDGDGLASGILFEDFCRKKKCKDVEVFFLDYYSPARISDSRPARFNKFLIADLAPSAISRELPLLDHGEVLYTDHHKEDFDNPIEDFVMELRTTSEGYIPSSRTVYELTEKGDKDKLWLATAGILSDKGDKYDANDKFLEEAYEALKADSTRMHDVTKKLENVIVFFSQDLQRAHRELRAVKRLEDVHQLSPFFKPVEEEMTRLTEDYRIHREKTDEKVFYFFDTKYPTIKSPFINRISSTNGLNVLVFASPKENGIVSLSARNQAKFYDVSILMRDCVEGLRNGKTGGHNFAAAGSIRAEDLDEFKKRFASYELERARIKNEKR